MLGERIMIAANRAYFEFVDLIAAGTTSEQVVGLM